MLVRLTDFAIFSDAVDYNNDGMRDLLLIQILNERPLVSRYLLAKPKLLSLIELVIEDLAYAHCDGVLEVSQSIDFSHFTNVLAIYL